MRASRILWTMLAAVFPLAALAGNVEPNLAERIASAGPGEKFSVIIRMADQVDMQKVKSDLKNRKAALAERHKVVIESLKLRAETTQRDIIAYLNSAKNSGAVTDFKPFWIANIIWLEAPGSEIEKLALRSDVEAIYLTPKVTLVEPVEYYQVDYSAGVNGAQPGINVVKAPQVWAMGYRGKGRLVCNIDTGVDGTHAALSARWRGNFLPPDPVSIREAWFDPVFGSIVPRDNQGGAQGHGTFTMGLICGTRSGGITDTIGVAPEAQWIAARAIDIGATWPVEIGAMQWAADPDGDPNTLDDVPDVVNNSWGIPRYSPTNCALILPDAACLNIYWNAIDNLAAAGPVVLFAAGNEGTCAGGISNLRIPADRITTEYNVFSVGSVNGNDTLCPGPTCPVSGFSSRGPSPCDGTTIKPEVMAPGAAVTSACPGGYCNGSGTSFSTPVVAGAVALLKQINPNATAEEIMNALFVTAIDISTAGPDNNSGNGLIDILDAIDSLPALTGPRIFISEYEFLGDGNGAPDPGEGMTFSATLINDGLNADSVKLTLTSASGLATVTDSISSLGSMAQFDTLPAFDFMTFNVSSGAEIGDQLPFNLKINAAGGYVQNYSLLFYVTAQPTQSKATHDKANFLFTVSNYGQYGFGTGSLNQGLYSDSGRGFKYPKAGTSFLFEASVLFGINSTQVSDGARDGGGSSPDSDFTVVPGGNLVFDTTSPGKLSAQDGFGIFNDDQAESPMGIKVVQRSFVFSDTANDDYAIIEYTLHNTTGSPINGLRAGFYTDWDFPWGSGASDLAGFIDSLEMGYMFQNGNTNYRAVIVTDTTGVTSFRAIENSPTIYDGFTDAEKWTYMSGGFIDTVNLSATDGSMLIATGPYNIPTGDSIRTSFAIVAATTLANLQVYAQRAIDKYRTGLFCLAIPGDANQSGDITLADVIHLVNYVFNKPGGPWEPDPFCRGDANGNGSVTLGDVIQLVNYYFNKPGGPWDPVPTASCCIPLP